MTYCLFDPGDPLPDAPPEPRPAKPARSRRAARTPTLPGMLVELLPGIWGEQGPHCWCIWVGGGDASKTGKVEVGSWCRAGANGTGSACVRGVLFGGVPTVEAAARVFAREVKGCR